MGETMGGGANRLAVFDCDGTLVDSQHVIVAAMACAFRENGLAEPDPACVRRLVGLHVADAVSRLLPGAPAEVIAAVGLGFVESGRILRDRQEHDELLFPGVVEVLEQLAAKDVLLAIATGKSRRGLERTLKQHGLGGHFLILKTADDGPGKPDPCILLDAIAEAGASPLSTVMIGDTVYDVAMARSAGAYALGVGWGYHEPEELNAAGAHAILRHFHELPPTLDTIWRTA
jgi:phosphoglycolate phosphatase